MLSCYGRDGFVSEERRVCGPKGRVSLRHNSLGMKVFDQLVLRVVHVQFKLLNVVINQYCRESYKTCETYLINGGNDLCRREYLLEFQLREVGDSDSSDFACVQVSIGKKYTQETSKRPFLTRASICFQVSLILQE